MLFKKENEQYFLYHFVPQESTLEQKVIFSKFLVQMKSRAPSKRNRKYCLTRIYYS